MMTKLNERIAAIPLPERMQRLPIDSRGFPVPWFVAWLNGEADFRIVDTPKIARAVNNRRCWLCGEQLGRHMAFVIGTMCLVNRVTAEPPSHRECAEYALQACPFLTQPRMRRNEKDLPDGHMEPGGVMLRRNPGVIVLWITNNYRPFKSDGGGVLFRLSAPSALRFYREGRDATREELLESINSGMPALHEIARKQGLGAERALAREYADALRLVPA